MDKPYDLEYLRIVGAVIYEMKDQRKKDTAQIPISPYKTGQDTVGRKMDVRHEREVGAVIRLKEDSY